MEELISTLADATIGDTFNFYRDGEGAEIRRSRLLTYLRGHETAPLLLVGEAPGYRGARVSGIPFTSERQLTGNGPAEATATIVHRTIAQLDVEGDVLLWNVVPTHPHEPGRPDTNRRPSRVEVQTSSRFLEAVTRGRRVVAVGRIAQEVTGAPYVRHPSHGGAGDFRRDLEALLLRFSAGARWCAAFP